MRRKKILITALVIAALSTISAFKTYAASTSMPSGTVVIGTKAFDLAYANDSKNLAEITAAIVAGGHVYVKGFDAAWVDNDTFNTVAATIIPSVAYKGSTGILTTYAIGDSLTDTTSTLEVVSIE